ncbi:MAG: hypothetical protein GY938_13495 [Ketobacter sp.]|nr:hypothetical protein [Ketobacter sp.]
MALVRQNVFFDAVAIIQVEGYREVELLALGAMEAVPGGAGELQTVVQADLLDRHAGVRSVESVVRLALHAHSGVLSQTVLNRRDLGAGVGHQLVARGAADAGCWVREANAIQDFGNDGATEILHEFVAHGRALRAAD